MYALGVYHQQNCCCFCAAGTAARLARWRTGSSTGLSANNSRRQLEQQQQQQQQPQQGRQLSQLWQLHQQPLEKHPDLQVTELVAEASRRS
jgi:hypothetical protein